MSRSEREPRIPKPREVNLREKCNPFGFLRNKPEKNSVTYAFTGIQVPLTLNIPETPKLELDFHLIPLQRTDDERLEKAMYFGTVAPFTPEAAYQPSIEDASTTSKLRKWIDLVESGESYIDFDKAELELNVNAPFSKNQKWFDLNNPRLHEDGRIARYFLHKDLKEKLKRLRIWIDFPTNVSYKGRIGYSRQDMNFWDFMPSELGRQAPGVLMPGQSPVGFVMGSPYGYFILLPSSPGLLSQMQVSFTLAGQEEIDLERGMIKDK